LTANAYLGGFGIARALHHGADIVITGRVADASLFPTPIGVNPMETIMALSTRAAGYVIDNAARFLS
jgi:choline dehydrogenase-like flavoprotein